MNTALAATESVARDRGAWIQTYTGRQFHYADPRPEEIHIADVAHALANLCRYAGHSDRFYSVAEHSVLVSRQFVDPEMRMIGLLHDATEAYCVDIPRPLKRMLPQYMTYEDGLWRVIASKFGLPAEIPAAVHDIDTRMLITERPQIFRQVIPWPKYAHVVPLEGVVVQSLAPAQAEQQFLDTYHSIRVMR